MVANNAAAMARAMRLVLMGQAEAMAKGAVANVVIDIGPLIPVWAEGDYDIGDVRMQEGVPWRCCQKHSSKSNAGWKPGNAASLWAPYHATDAAHALPWVKPTGAHDAYQVGEHMIWTDGKVYRCNTAAVVHSPAEIPAVWGVVT